MAHRIKDSFKLALAQLDAVVGDIDGNLRRAREARARAAQAGADLIAFTELFLTGYPHRGSGAEAGLAESGAGGAGVAGARYQGRRAGRADRPALRRRTVRLQRRSSAWIEAASRRCRFKNNLPNYGVFDEKRVFAPGPMPAPIEFRGDQARRSGLRGYLERASVQGAGCRDGAELLIVPNGSPYWIDKQDVRYGVAEARVTETRAAARLRQSGRRTGRARVRRRLLRAERRMRALPCSCRPGRRRSASPSGGARTGGWRCLPGLIADDRGGRCRELSRLRARACATTWTKNGFPGVVLGLSGGIDSALVRGDRRRCAGA